MTFFDTTSVKQRLCPGPGLGPARVKSSGLKGSRQWAQPPVPTTGATRDGCVRGSGPAGSGQQPRQALQSVRHPPSSQALHALFPPPGRLFLTLH